MHKHGSIIDITYKDYTNTSRLSGIPDSSSEPDSLINIIKNVVYVYQTPIKVAEKENVNDKNDV